MNKLSQRTYRFGENTRDNPQEFEVEQVQSLVNCYPTHPDPRPREGTGQWNTNDWPEEITFLIPYRDDVNGDKVIGIGGRSIYWMEEGNTPPATIASNYFPEVNIPISYERFFDSVYVCPEYEDENLNFIIEWNEILGNFEVRKTFINYEDLGLTVTVDSTSEASGLDAEYYGYAYTLVNLGNVTGNQIAYTTGLLESPADLDNAIIVNLTASAPQIHTLVDTLSDPTDPQVTHIRVWRTVGYATSAEAQTAIGAGEMNFLADVDINAQFVDTVTDTELAGETNAILPQVGLDAMPIATDILYHNGLMWISPLDRSERGKWYYSNPIVDAVNPLKYVSYYNLTDRFIETSLNNSEANTALGVAGNDVYYFMEESVWFLRDGDVTFGPRKVSNTQGSVFPKAFTKIDNKIFYISNNGPAYVSDQRIQMIDGMASGEVWPITFYGKGEFFALGDPDGLNAFKKNVISFYHKDTWFVCHRDIVIGFHMPKNNRSSGCFKVEFGDSELRIGSVAILDIDTCIIASKNDVYYGTYPDPKVIGRGGYRFLWDAIQTDIFSIFTLKSKSMAFQVIGKERDLSGEVYSLKAYATFTDLGEFRFRITTDFIRRIVSFIYDERPKSNTLQNQSIDNKGAGQLQSKTEWRTVLQQGVPEGMIGRYFEIEWEKNYLPPFDFRMEGFDIEYLPRIEQPMEFVSLSEGVQEAPLEPPLDAKIFALLKTQ